MSKVTYTEKEALDWHNNLPSKRCSAKIIARNSEGSVLILKPNYRDYWQLPGGIIEAGESPKIGGLREFMEETGLSIPSELCRFVGVKYSGQHAEFLDFVHFFFDVGILNNDQIGQLKLNTTEHEAFEFIKGEDIGQRVAAHEVTYHLQFLAAPNLPHGLYLD